MTPSSSEFDPADQALEHELQNLQPSPPSDALMDRLTSSLSVTEANLDSALERELMTMQAAQVSPSLFARIESAMEVAEETALEMPSNVVSVPQWRDFMPIFRVAAVLAVCVGILAMWTNPPSPSTAAESTTPNHHSEPPISVGPTLKSLQPVSVDSTVLQNGEMIQSKRYRFPDMVIEDEVTWEPPRAQKAY